MLAYVFVLLAVASRLLYLPHPWNFTPVAAALLYFGARGSRRQMWMPVVLLIAADLILDNYYHYPLSWDLLLTWGWYAGMLWLGSNLRENSKWLRIAGAALTGSISFFLISNFGVWAATHIYPKSTSGLMACYAAGVPFFRNTLAGDLLYTAAMFGLPVLAAAIARSMKARGTIAAA